LKFPASRLLLIAMFSLVAYMAWNLQKRIYENKGRLTVAQSQIFPGAIELVWNSSIEVPMAKRMQEAFEKWRDKTDHFIINLNSPGGSLREGRAVIGVINHMKQSHRVDTYVSPGHDCLSMCVPIFLQGQTRAAHHTSRWMFHAPRLVEQFTDKEINVPRSERRALADRFFRKYFDHWK